MNKKYQIFISSTYIDLVEPRQKVIESILKLYHFPIGMEMFSAADDEQWDIIKETIDSSDFYIILVGSRYGSLTKEGISYTEKEYDYAKKIGLPILTFLKDEGLPTTPQERESDIEKIQKLKAFRSKAQQNKVREVWINSDDLATRVSVALMKEFARKNRVGWIRGDSVSEEASRELLELSKENRELREKVAKLETLTNSRKPIIKFALQESDLLCFSVPYLKWNKGSIEVPKKISIEIPQHLINFLSLHDIEKYNSSIPSEKELNEYEKKLKLFVFSKFSYDLKMSIENVGNYKATNINIELVFPNFVKVLKKNVLNEMSLPKDVIPPNPVTKAEHTYQLSLKNTLSRHSAFNIVNREYDFNMRPELYLKRPSMPLVNEVPIYSIQGNSFVINLPSLLHTRNKEIFNQVSIIPLEEGSGDIIINIICEEMESLESILIPITVNTDETLDFKRDHYDPN